MPFQRYSSNLKQQQWQSDRYREKIGKYYDRQKQAAYDEFIQFKRDMAEAEEIFLKRLPKRDPSAMKMKIKEVEKSYREGDLNINPTATKTRTDIIEDIYGMRPFVFTHEPNRPLNYVENDIVYLEGEKFVQDWEIPKIDVEKEKKKGTCPHYFEEQMAPMNSCIDSEADEEFDAEKEITDSVVKFENQREAEYAKKKEQE